MRRAGSVRRPRPAEIERQLAPRDRLVVDTLDRVRLATTVQLHRLLTLSEPTTLRRTQAALARLARARVIVRLDRRVGGVRAGSAGSVYALDTLGQRLASGCGPAGGRRRRRPWTPGLLFVTHQLAVAELFVRLREAQQTGALSILDFDAEPLCWRTFTGAAGARTILRPDAFVRLGIGDFQDVYFIEVDQGTQSLPAIARKLVMYRRCYVAGREQQRFGAFPEVLFLAPDPARRDALASLIAGQPEPIPRFATAALQEDAPALLTEERP